MRLLTQIQLQSYQNIPWIFSDEDERHYAQTFLFHQDVNHDYINGITTRTVNYDATFMDDICVGICPFRFIDKFPYPDAPEITLDWCELLVDLESPLLGEYIEKGLFFHSFTSIAKSITSPKALSQLAALSKYLKKEYDYDL